MSAETPHLLLVDDEAAIHEPLSDYLRDNGFRVTVAERADAARGEIDRGGVDLVLLDIMMPGEDGLSLTRTIRAHSSLPVILLTARAEDTDRIVGLEMGADDYVVKPFNPRELLARIKAVLRRGNGGPPPESGGQFRFSGFQLDPDARRLIGPDGEEIPLTGGEFALLHALLCEAGRVLSRDRLLDLTQGRDLGVFDRSVDNQISRLRKKIEPDLKTPTIIKTVRGGGYVLAGPVTRR